MTLGTHPSRRSFSCVSVFHRCSQEDSKLSPFYRTFGQLLILHFSVIRVASVFSELLLLLPELFETLLSLCFDASALCEILCLCVLCHSCPVENLPFNMCLLVILCPVSNKIRSACVFCALVELRTPEDHVPVFFYGHVIVSPLISRSILRERNDETKPVFRPRIV